jgi:YHS domain-containing protein
MKKIICLSVVGLSVLGVAVLAFAMMGMCAAEDVGNKICPVTGDKINEEAKTTYEYKDKTYNFCCPMCIGEFKKNPEKYIEKIKEQETEEGHEHHH